MGEIKHRGADARLVDGVLVYDVFVHPPMEEAYRFSAVDSSDFFLERKRHLAVVAAKDETIKKIARWAQEHCNCLGTPPDVPEPCETEAFLRSLGIEVPE